MKDTTIVVQTCYRQAHPSTKVLDGTIESLHRELPGTPIIITCDGVKDEMTPSQMANYDGFKQTIEGRYENAHVIAFKEWGHQSGNFGAILDMIKTPLIFYCEDDWDIRPHVPWDDFARLILTGEFNYIKLHAGVRIHPLHEHMMKGRVHFSEKLYFVKTVQFSANPHLASTEWYRQLYRDYMIGRKEFIEGIMHGPCAAPSAEAADWSKFKMAIYDPVDYDMYRCLHLDGKGSTD